MFIASTNQMQSIHTNRPRLDDIKLHYIIIKRTFFETKLHFPPISLSLSYKLHKSTIFSNGKHAKFSFLSNLASLSFKSEWKRT